MSYVLFLLGLLATLIGLLLIGAQVNKHQIRPKSAAAWIFRCGALALFLALLLPPAEPLILQVVRLMGAALVATSVIMLNHEWTQAGAVRQPEYHFQPTADMLLFFFSALLGSVTVLIGFAQQAVWATPVTWIVLIGMLLFGIRLQYSTERVRAGFNLLLSLTFQVFACGALILMVGAIEGSRYP